MPTEATPAQLDAENPWPGLLSFTEGGQAFFHGRDADIAELLRLVQRQTLTVLFGQSGLGKTSLLSAGLFPKLRLLEFLPVPIRLALHDGALPPLQRVWDKLAANRREHGVEARAPEPGETLWAYFHGRTTDFWDSRSRLITPVLVFDQFEEVFTVGRGGSGVQELLDQLAELVENRTPASVKQALEDDPESAGRFDFGRAACKVVLSFREDLLPQFEGLRRTMPSSAGERMRLRRMNGLQARDAILLSGRDLVADAVAEEIIAFVAGERRAGQRTEPPTEAELEQMEIDPPLLSLVCRQLNTKRQVAGNKRITADLLADEHDEILKEFYRNSVADLGEPVRRFIEDQLLTTDGFRDSRALADALATPGVTREAINALVERRLLRLEERSRALRVELAHDVLTKVIRQERDRRREGEAVRREREQREALERLAQEAFARERTARREVVRTRAIAWAMFALLVAAVGAGGWALRERRVAEQRTAEAENNLRAVLAIASRNVRIVDATFDAQRISRDVARALLKGSHDALADLPVENQTVEVLRAELQIFSQLNSFYSRIDDIELMLASAQTEQRIADRLALSVPGDPGMQDGRIDARVDLGGALADGGELAEGLSTASDTLQIAVQADEAAPGRDAGKERLAEVRSLIASIDLQRHELPAALDEIREVIRLREELASQHPDDLAVGYRLARAYRRHADIQAARGDLATAEQELGRADEVIGRIRGKSTASNILDREQALIDLEIAAIRTAHGNPKTAVKPLRLHAGQLSSRAAPDSPDMDWQETALRFTLLGGDGLRASGNLDGARTEYDRRYEDLRQWARGRNPYVNWLKYLIEHDIKVGDLDVQRGHLGDAMKSYRLADRTATDLLERHPSYIAATALRASARFGIGEVEAAQGHPDAAWTAFSDGLALLRPLVEAHPDDALWQHDLAVAEGKAAAIRATLGDPAQSRSLLHEATTTLARLTAMDPRNATWRLELDQLRQSGAAKPDPL